MIKNKNARTRPIIYIYQLSIGLVAYLLMTSIFANPVLDHVTNGNVTVSQTPNSTVIHQSSPKAIINWQSFNIGASQSTHFQQPKGGVALNRINPSQGVSQIYGRLTATGQIILINPAGIFFGPSAYVNVGGLIASTANISDSDFLNGYYHFTHVDGFNGAIINEGQIIAAKNGLIALIGAGVSNDGYIEANVGHAVLASGDAFTLTFANNDLISFSVDKGVSSTPTDQHGKPMKSGVSNTGKIVADGGDILISAKDASNVLDNVISMNGIAQARSVSTSNGTIILEGDNTQGVVAVDGVLDTSGTTPGLTGGNIAISGYNILLGGHAVLDASGASGGGNINIGGSAQGLGPLPNAHAVVMQLGAFINASALTNGNGGNVVLWSNYLTNAQGNIIAQGGFENGHGGFVETSSHNVLNVNNLLVNTTAANGVTGTWLLDPTNIWIALNQANATTAGMSGTDNSADTATGTNPKIFQASGAVSDSLLTTANLTAALATNNVLVSTSNASGLGAGNITVVDPFSWSSGNSLTLTADNNIAINAAITTGTAASSLILNASGSVTQSALIGGSGGLTQSGSGTVTLSMANTYTGVTNITNGVLSINTIGNSGTNTALGNSSSAINLGAGTLQYTGTGSTSSRVINLTSSAATIDASGSGTLTLSGGVTGSTFNLLLTGTGAGTESGVINTTTGTLTKSGTGTWTLSNAANTYTGATSILGGTLNVSVIANGGTNSSLGATAASTPITLSGGKLSYTGSAASMNRQFATAGAGGIIQSTTATLTLSGNIDNAAGLTLTPTAGNIVISGVISNVGGVTVNGSGTATLSGSNSYTGATSVTSGTLSFNSITNVNGGNSALGAPTTIGNGTINLGPGTLQYTGGATTTDRIINLTNSGTINTSSTGLLTLSGGITGSNTDLTLAGTATGTAIQNGVISLGTGALNVTGGTWTLNNANNYSGVTSVINSTGTLILNNNQALSNSSGITIQNGILGLNFSGTLANSNLISYYGSGYINDVTTSPITLNNTLQFFTNVTVASVVSGGSLTLGNMSGGVGGFVDVRFSGAGNINVAGNLTKGSASTMRVYQNGTGTLTLSGVNNFSVLNAQSGITIINNNSGLAGTNSSTVSSGATLEIMSAGIGTLAQIIVNGTGVGGLGALYIPSGVSTSISFLQALSSATINVDSGATLSIPNGMQALTNSTLTLIGAGNINATQVVNNGGILSVTKAGTGTLTLSGSTNTFTGNLNIQSGTVALAVRNTLPSAQIIISGGTLQFLSGAGGIFTNTNAITLSGAGTGGTGAISILSTGGTTLNNAINLTGSALINSTQALTLGGNITNTATNTPVTLSFTGNGNITASGVISDGAGTSTLGINQSGTATAILTGANTYSGGTTINSGTLQIGNNSATGTLGFNNASNAVINNGTLIFALTSNYNVSNIISGNGTIKQNGSGILTLSGTNNSFTGNTLLSTGTLVAANTQAFGSSTATLSLSGGILDLATDSSITPYNTTVNGSVTITSDLATTGTAITHTLGNLNIGANTLTLQAGANVSSGIAGLTFGTTTLTGNGTFSSAASTLLTLGALNDGGVARTIAFNGVGTSALASAATSLVSGSTINITNGIFNSNQATALGGLATISVGSGATLNVGASQTLGSLTGAGNVAMIGAVTLTVGNSNNLSSTYSGVMSGASGALTTAGTGTLTLSGNNTYGGTTTINNLSTLKIGINNALPSGASTGDIVANGKLDMNGFNLSINGLSGSGVVDNVSAAGTPALTLGGNNATSNFSGIIQNTTGTLSITKQGSGTLTLSGANTYTGKTTISAGTISINTLANVNGGASALGAPTSTANGTIDINATGVLQYTGTGHSSNRVINLTASSGTIDASGSGTFILSGGVTGNTFNLTLNGNGTGIESGVINTTTGTVTKSGTGTWILSGGNTYSGTTTISAGTLQIGNGGSTGSAGTGSIVNNAALIYNLTSSPTLPNMSGTGSFTQNGTGTLATPASATFSGGTTINSGKISFNTSTFGTGSVTVNPGGTASTGINFSNAIILNGGNLSTPFAGGFGNVSSVTLTAPSFTTNVAGSTLAIYNITDGSNSYSITQIGAGTVVYGGNNANFHGGIIATAGGVMFGSNTTPFGTGTMTLSNLTVQDSGVGGYTIPNAISLGAGVTFLTNNAWGISGTMTGSNGFTANAINNPLTISGNNSSSLSGTVTVIAGSLVAANTNAFNANIALVLSGGNFTLNNNTTLGSISGGSGNNISLNTSTLTTGGNNTSTSFAGTITGTGGLVKTGTGTLTLTAANTYSGATTINGGTLQAGVNNAISSNSAVTLANTAGATFDLNNFNDTIGSLAGGGSTGGNVTLGSGSLTVGGNNTSTSYNGIISGTGNISKSGTGIWTLTGSSSFSGITTISAGTLSINSIADVNGGNSALGTPTSAANGTINIGATGVLQYTGTGHSSNRVISLLASGGTINASGSGALVLTGGIIANGGANNFNIVLTGTGSATESGNITNQNATLTKSGSGNWTLSGTNSYGNGNSTIISGGTLTISSDANLGASPVGFDATNIQISGGGILQANAATPFTIDPNRGVTLGAGGGQLQVSAGTLTYNAVFAGANALTLSGPGSLSTSANITAPASITAASSLALSFGGTALTAAAGALNLNAATITLTNGGTVTLTATGATSDLTLGSLNSSISNTVNLVAGRNIIINGALTNAAGSLNLTATNASQSITTGASGTIAVNNFNLLQGQWYQVGTLPSFTIGNNFQIRSGTGANGLVQFIRATSGNGSSSTPYTLVDVYGLQGIGSNNTTLAQYFTLAGNINASSTATWNSGGGFVPISIGGSNYSGTFNGAGFAINGLIINYPATNNIGLFSQMTAAGVIQNISVTNATITGATMTGGVVGNNLGTLTNVSVSGAVTGVSGNYTGGLAGLNQGSISGSTNSAAVTGVNYVGGLTGYHISGTISTSGSSGTVSGSGSNIGGIAGYNKGTIASTVQVLNGSTVTGTGASGNYVGGFVGYNDTTSTLSSVVNPATNTVNAPNYNYVGGVIGFNASSSSNVANLATVTGSAFVGGVVGYLNSGTTLQNAYSTGAVNGITEVGGLVGRNVGTVTATVLGNSYSLGTVTGLSATSQSYVAGIVGRNWPGATISNVYNAGTVTTTNNVYSYVGGIAGFNGSTSTISNSYNTGNVTGNTYVGGIDGVNSGIVSNSHNTGNITGVNQVGGIIGFADFPTSTLTNVYSTGAISGVTMVGGIAGENFGVITATVPGLTYASGSVTGTSATAQSYLGGLVGLNGPNNASSISNAYNAATVSSINNNYISVGGIAGAMGLGPFGTSSTITNSYNIGNVSGGTNVGGIVGNAYTSGTTISNVYSTGTVTGVTNVGGIAGNLNGGNVNQVYNLGKVLNDATQVSPSAFGGVIGLMSSSSTMTNAYNSGYINANQGGQSSSNVGGVIGSMDASSNSIGFLYNTGNVTGASNTGGLIGSASSTPTFTGTSYWNSDTSGQTVGVSNLTDSNIITANTTQMTTQATFAGWDFSTTWSIVANQSYPYLQVFYPSTPRVIAATGNTASGLQAILNINGSQFDTAYTSANGTVYFLEGNNVISGINNTIADNSLVFMYYPVAATNYSNAIAYVPASNGSLGLSNSLSLLINTVTVGSSSLANTQTYNNTTLATALGSLTGSNILFSLSGNDLTINSGNNFLVTSPTTYNLNGNIATTNGNITLNGPVSLTTSPTLTTTNSGDITFSSTLDGDTANTRNLTITSAGSIIFNADVGGINPLSSVNFNSPVIINNTTGITTIGAQTYTGLTATGNATLTSNSSGTITLDGASAFNGPGNLTVNDAGGLVNIASAATTSTYLNNLSITAATIDTFPAVITTSGNQIYNGNVVGTATGGGLFIATSNNGSITTNGTVNGYAVILTANNGTLNINDNIGSPTTVSAAIQLTAPSIIFASNVTGVYGQIDGQGCCTNLNGDITINNGSFTIQGRGVAVGAINDTVTDGTINIIDGDFNQHVAINGNITIPGTNGSLNVTRTNGGSYIQFSTNANTIDVANQTYTLDNFIFDGPLTLKNTGGTVQVNMNSPISGSSNALSILGNLTTSLAETTSFGSLNVTGNTVLGGNTIFIANSGNIIFGNKINGAFDLTLNAANGLVELNNAVGDSAALSSLTINAPSININAAAINTVNDQTYQGLINLGNDAAFTSTGGNLWFANGVAGTNVAFAANAVTGDVTLAGNLYLAVGVTNALDITAGGTIFLNSDSIQTDFGNQTYNGNVVLQRNVGIIWENPIYTLTFNGSINGTTAGAQSLTLSNYDNNNNSGGIANFNGAIGNLVPLGGLDVSLQGNTVNFNQPITINGNMNVNTNWISSGGDSSIHFVSGANVNATGSVTLVANNSGVNTAITIDSNISAASINATVGSTSSTGLTLSPGSQLFSTGATNLTSGDSVNLSGLIGSSTNPLGSLSVTGSAININSGVGSEIFVNGAQIYTGPVAINNLAAIKFDGTSTTFNQTLDSPTLASAVTIAGNFIANNAVGSINPLDSLIVNGTSSLNNNITTNNSQTYTDTVTLTNDVVLTNLIAGNIAINNILNGGGHTLTINSLTNNVISSAINGLSNLTNLGSGSLTISGLLTVNTGGTTLTQESGAGVFSVTGGIDGNGDLLINNNGSINNGLVISNGDINNTGSVSNISSGTGSILLSANLGVDVTNLNQNSNSSTLILTGTNSYDTTTISAGILQIGNGGTTGSLGLGTVSNNTALVFNRNNTLIVDNNINGTGTLTQAGSGTVILTANNLYSGNTTINNGTLQIGNHGTIGSLGTGNVINNTALVFDLTDTATIDNQISGSGTVTEAGGGTLLLTNNNNYSGGTVLTNGTLSAGSNNAFGTGDVTINGSLNQNISGITLANNIILSGDSIIDNNNGLFTLNGSINGGYALTLNGASTTVLGNALGNTTALASLTSNSALNVNGGGVTTTGDQTYNNTVTLGADATFNMNGTGTHRLAFNNDITGGQNIILSGSNNGSYEFSLGHISANNVTVTTAPAASNNSLILDTGGTQNFIVNGVNLGIITNVANVSGNFNFNHIQNLTGGSGNNTFRFAGGSLSGNINGANGVSTLIANNVVNTWIINSNNGGTVTSLGGSFANIENLTGGTTRDYFNFLPGFSITGLVDGGDTTLRGNSINFNTYGTSLTLNLSPPINNVFDAGTVYLDASFIANFTHIQQSVGNNLGYIVLPKGVANIKVSRIPGDPSTLNGMISDPFYYLGWNIFNPPPVPPPTLAINAYIAQIMIQPVTNSQDSDSKLYYYYDGADDFYWDYLVINITPTFPLLENTTITKEISGMCWKQ